MIRYYLAMIALVLASALHAQTTPATPIAVRGVVTDSSGAPLTGVSVTLLRAADSVLTRFGATDTEGRFLLKKVPAGSYVLQASYLGYANAYRPVTVAAEPVDLGAIALQPSSALLGGVDIQAEHSPLRIRRDTIEYNAGAFQTQPGAVVEDLLKKLPGVEVQPDGSIRAHGKEVRQVTVDGKEFFGNDPQIATKNLPADAVDKVQVFDKKSDQAEFSGVDDGRRQRTINLELKEDKKQGVFGNAGAGYGTDNRYEGRFNVNRFNKNTQFSGIGNINNTNQRGFSFNDYMNFMGGIQNFFGGGGGGMRSVRVQFDSEDDMPPVGMGPAEGYNNIGAGGLNFNHEFNPDVKLNASYFYNRIDSEVDRFTQRQNLFGENSFNQDQTDLRDNLQNQHRLNATLRWSLDSSQNFILRAGAGIQDGRVNSLQDSRSATLAGLLQNTGERRYQSERGAHQFNSSLVYRRRLARPGRSLVAELSGSLRDNQRDADLFALNQYFGADTAAIDRDTVNQRQDQGDNQANYAASVSFTEPLGKRRYLEAHVAVQNYRNTLAKDFYDIRYDPNRRESLNNLLSDQFRQDFLYSRAGLNYRLNRKDYNITVGAAYQLSQLNGESRRADTPFRRDFHNVLPSFRLNYNFSSSHNLSFDYETSVREPNLEQLQPVVDNSDPLNLYQGNPNLRPEYQHNFNLHYVRFDQFTSSSLFANVFATYSAHPIVNARVVDTLFRQIMQPVNVDYGLTINGFGGYSMPLKPLRSRVRLETGLRFNRGLNFVNEQENTTDRLTASVDLSLENRDKEVWDLTVGARLEHNQSWFSAGAALNQTYLNQVYYGDLTVNLGKYWAVSGGMDYRIFGGEAFAERRELPIGRASVTRYLLKDRRGQLKLSVFDLLNRNAGIRRSSDLNLIEEVRIPTLARYALLSFTYQLSDFGGPNVTVDIRGGR